MAREVFAKEKTILTVLLLHFAEGQAREKQEHTFAQRSAAEINKCSKTENTILIRPDLKRKKTLYG